ncbi:hypothetical protein L0A91_00955 [Ornithinimicrobium sp. INDO-MA30-4]|nr:hypothetical protein L0A91_00955 [Ornithinimicrobium sp. INDO-MA30-4]
MSISGGATTVYGPTTNWQGALDSNGTFTISGGDLLAVGSAGMVINPEVDSQQGWFSLNLVDVIPTDTEIELQESNGSTLNTFSTIKDTQNVTFSSADVSAGETYTVVIDGESFDVTAGETPEATAADGPGSVQQP